LVTTTAVVAGFVCIELLKIVQQKPLDHYKNICFNLALPLFATSEPGEAPAKTMHNGDKWTLWTRFQLQAPLTLQQFLDHFQV
jgi:ubiquitin-activating enzyme E1